jgi:phosphatidylinositol glycan class B
MQLQLMKIPSPSARDAIRYIVPAFATFSLVIHCLFGYLCLGHYHPDEHFQILEFATVKLPFSASSKADLPWEFHEQIRSTIQPWLVIGLAKFLHLLNLYTPFLTALILQISAALFGWTVNLLLYNQVALSIRHQYIKILLCALFCFCYFFPFIHSRFSSESVGGSFFILGIVLILKAKHDIVRDTACQQLITGFIMGLAFLCRFQIAFAILGLFFWFIFSERTRPLKLIRLASGFFIAVFLGFLLDRLYYGNWVFTPWQYLNSNIIEDRVSNYGVMPVWGYITLLYQYLISPYSVLIMVMLGLSFFKLRGNIFVFTFVPFLVLHSLIGHKEVRFMFPLMSVIPILLCLTLDTFKRNRKVEWLFGIVTAGFIITNTYVSFSLLQPLNPTIGLYRFIYDHYNSGSPNSQVNLLFVDHNPYKAVFLNVNFYKPKNLRIYGTTSDTSIFLKFPGVDPDHSLMVTLGESVNDSKGAFSKLIYRDKYWCLYKLNKLRKTANH